MTPRFAKEGAARRTKDERRLEAQARADRARRLRALRERVTAVESEVGASESRLDEIDARLADPGTYQIDGLARTLGEQRKAIQVELSRLSREWEEALTRLERAEKESDES